MLNTLDRIYKKIVNSKAQFSSISVIKNKGEVEFLFDDAKYKKYFDQTIGASIYQSHLENYLVCCAFCSQLKRSSCHEYCFKCLKGTYAGCSILLPGTFSFTGNYFDLTDQELVPWLFRTPCTDYERLDKKYYFKNFNAFEQSISVANYEALEGIFRGISRGKKPCHICASVNIEIFNRCTKNDKLTRSGPCSIIMHEISKKYQSTQGMIKYVD